jgi:hypothetical protein
MHIHQKALLTIGPFLGDLLLPTENFELFYLLNLKRNANANNQIQDNRFYSWTFHEPGELGRLDKIF